MKQTLQELAENAINIQSADPEVCQRTRAAQADYYERLLTTLDPVEQVEKIIDAGHFLIWLPSSKLAAHVSRLALKADPMDFERILTKLLCSAIHHGAIAALNTILESVKDGQVLLDVGKIGPWDDALVDQFAAHQHAVKLRFTPCFEWQGDLSWQGFLKLFQLTVADSREDSITSLGRSNWTCLDWLFFLILAGKITDEMLAPPVKEHVMVKYLISANHSSFRSCPVLNTFILSHTPEEMNALFLRVNQNFNSNPFWVNALLRAQQVIVKQLQPLAE